MKTQQDTKLTKTAALKTGDVIRESNRNVTITNIERGATYGRTRLFRVTLSTGRTLGCAADARWMKVL